MKRDNKSLCYPVRKKLVENRTCKVEWELLNEVGVRGAHGQVWSVCCENDCQHVLKYMPYEDNDKDAILNEIVVQQKCASLGLCPLVEDAWLCDDGGAMVMTMYQITARQLLLAYTDPEIRNRILDSIISLVQSLHANGMYHGDLHLDNIMINSKKILPVLDEMINYENSEYKFYFIDFGTGGFMVHDNERILEDYMAIYDHINDLMYERPNDNFKTLYDRMKKYTQNLIS